MLTMKVLPFSANRNTLANKSTEIPFGITFDGLQYLERIPSGIKKLEGVDGITVTIKKNTTDVLQEKSPYYIIEIALSKYKNPLKFLCPNPDGFEVITDLYLKRSKFLLQSIENQNNVV